MSITVQTIIFLLPEQLPVGCGDSSPLHTTKHKKILLKTLCHVLDCCCDLLLLPASGDTMLRQSRSRDGAFLEHSQGWTVSIICKHGLVLFTRNNSHLSCQQSLFNCRPLSLPLPTSPLFPKEKISLILFIF